jgi:Stress responsive A/B Barrel Domain
MAMRVVMVEFYPEVTEQDVAEFQGWLHDLAARLPYLIRMQCGPHSTLLADKEFSLNAPSVSYGHFASVWEFADEDGINQFIQEPFHKEIASKKFKKLVKHRYCVNFL